MESPVRTWLELQCQMISGTAAGLVVLGGSEHAPGAEVFRWPADREPSPGLSVAVATARERGSLALQTPASDRQPSDAATQLAIPVLRDGVVVGAFGVSVRGIPAAEAKALAGLVGHCALGLGLLLETADASRRLASRLSLAGALLDQRGLREAAHELCVSLTALLGCERVALGFEVAGRLRVVGLSHGLQLASGSDAVRDLQRAMEEAIEEDAVVELSSAADLRSPAHEELLRGSGSQAVCTVPLVAHGRAVGALVCEWSQAARLDAAARTRTQDAALLCGPILELLERAEAGLWPRARVLVADWIERHFGADHGLAKSLLAAGAVAVLLLAVLPGTHRVSARASLEGRVQRALVAGVDGYLAEASARAGDVVEAGELLARLDDRDLRLERRERASEKAQLETEYREVLAAGERTKVSLLQARIEQAAAQLALADEKLGRTQITAPFDGIVLRGDLDQSLGSPVEIGGVLFEIAPLDGYRIIVEVDGRDIADVEVGQTGRLALAALPDEALPLVVDRITPIATAGTGRSYFRVEAELSEPRAELRPGMEGIAKIEIGRRRLLWIWTHELLDWLRLSIWSWIP